MSLLLTPSPMFIIIIIITIINFVSCIQRFNVPLDGAAAVSKGRLQSNNFNSVCDDILGFKILNFSGNRAGLAEFESFLRIIASTERVHLRIPNTVLSGTLL
jgi:hypothetical protein